MFSKLLCLMVLGGYLSAGHLEINDLKEIFDHLSSREDKIKLAFFDLDGTLITNGIRFSDRDPKDNYTKKMLTEKNIRTYLENLKDKGYLLYIISRSDIESIEQKLDSVGLNDMFKLFSCQNKEKKSSKVNGIIESVGGIEKIGHILFVDDTLFEVEDMNEYVKNNNIPSSIMYFHFGDFLGNFHALYSVAFDDYFDNGEFFESSLKDILPELKTTDNDLEKIRNFYLFSPYWEERVLDEEDSM